MRLLRASCTEECNQTSSSNDWGRPALLRTGIPQCVVPPEVSLSHALWTRKRWHPLLVASSGASRWSGILLDFFLGLIRLLLLLLQVGDGSRIRSSRAVRILPGIGGRAGGNTLLALIFGQRFQARVELLSELVVHVLEVGDLDARGRSTRTVRLLAADNINGESVVLVGSGFGTHENVTGAESARLIIRGYI